MMKECKKLANMLMESQEKCDAHWEQKLYKKFNQNLLSLDYLDIEGKGFILKEDLARFISMFSKKLYSNREIAPLFKRMRRFGKSRTTILKY